MQRRLRIALAVTAAAGALALGAGTAFADAPSDGLNGANTPSLGSSSLPNQSSADPITGLGSSLGSPTQTSSDADSDDADSDDADAPDTDAATSTPGGLMSNGGNVSTPSLTGVGK
jgi:hypothetical protein